MWRNTCTLCVHGPSIADPRLRMRRAPYPSSSGLIINMCVVLINETDSERMKQRDKSDREREKGRENGESRHALCPWTFYSRPPPANAASSAQIFRFVNEKNSQARGRARRENTYMLMTVLYTYVWVSETVRVNQKGHNIKRDIERKRVKTEPMHALCPWTFCGNPPANAASSLPSSSGLRLFIICLPHHVSTLSLFVVFVLLPFSFFLLPSLCLYSRSHCPSLFFPSSFFLVCCFISHCYCQSFIMSSRSHPFALCSVLLSSAAFSSFVALISHYCCESPARKSYRIVSIRSQICQSHK